MYLRPHVPRLVGALLAALALPLAGCATDPGHGASLVYPPAARGDVVDHYGSGNTTVAVPDPYRWMEDIDAPATRAWVQEEAALTATQLAALPARAGLRARLAVLANYEKFGVPVQAGPYRYFTRNAGLQNQSVLYREARGEASADHPAQVVLDPNLLSKDGSLVLVGYVPSPDGERLAYGLSESGSDWTSWHLRDLASGRDLPDVLANTKYYPPAFSRDGKRLYYSAFPAPQAGAELATQDAGNALYEHVIGTAAGADRVLLSDSRHADWQYDPYVSSDGRWLIAMVGAGQVGDSGRENLILLDLSHPEAPPRTLVQDFAAAYVYVGADAGRLYFLTSQDAPRGRVVSMDPLQEGAVVWRTVVPQGSDAIDFADRSSGPASVTLVGHQLLVRGLHDARSRVLRYGQDGTLLGEVSFPGAGSVAGFAGEPGDLQVYYRYADLITPPSIYQLDLASGSSSLLRAPRSGFASADFVQQQVFYPASDGTRIPLVLAYRKGMVPDGHRPVLLYGYGGFGIPILADFDPAVVAWMEMGGVYAIANIRGGGEYGEEWHRQAIRERKQRVFDDFTDAAQWLVHQGYTQPARLAIQGASNGGLLMGACLTQRPELFGAVIAQVGVMDMLRFDRFGQGAGWTGDYGTPTDPADFSFLRAYSPVHNVRPGTRYPATLVITGDHDTRVMPMHSYKFAAALQAAQAGESPVLLDVELASGHGGGMNVSQELEQQADIYAFVARSLGMEERLDAQGPVRPLGTR